MLHTNKKWSLVRIGLMMLALIPAIIFLLIIGSLIWNSAPVVQAVGLENLFSDKISGSFSGTYIPNQFGLMPAIVGTLQVVILGLLFAFPFSLALAIAATEFSMGWLGRPIELLLSFFSGIPPIIYALTSVFVVTTFIRPKFGGIELADSLIATLPGLPPLNAGTLPLNQSTLLGGIFLALLIIPFMSPLILDAIRDVPLHQKEASLALGATRWFTLRRLILPGALPGIIAAISIGVLKATGDVVICAWTIGFIKDDGLPNPIFDIFEHNAPLTSTAAGLVGGLQGASVSLGLNTSAAYFAAFLLLVFAFTIIGLAEMCKKWLIRRNQA
ncbi:MAG TPA: ABC transporter permease subunit [Anaerolineaceae bacterium]|nr:ABC transporter permease subunit [Anaerolineaceae bacterium]